MKSFTILTLFSMLSTGFQNNVSLTNAPEETGSSVISALKKNSIEEYSALLPTLAEFHQIMDANDRLYGGFLSEAKSEFAIRYEQEIMPSVKAAFKSVIAEGNKRGINWQNVEFARVKNSGTPGQENPVQLDIVFSERGKEYTLRIQNAFIWQGQWRVTQFIELK
ncbi:MAG TPA: hypothetical protein VFG46_20230 [Chryseolinea sp.]|nr:hypothetical protein [Chryseolinea sp.]